MMHYLGQAIELMQEAEGWVAVWWNSAGYRIEIGFFPTACAAWDGIVEIIQRDLAVRSLLEVVEEWQLEAMISDREYALTTEALIQSVLV